MKLILHIGTQKTGSTALQKFFHENPTILSSHHVHYATPEGALMANGIANALNLGEVAAVRAFFDEHVLSAQAAGAETVLVSGENFYCLSAQAALRGYALEGDPIERERELIRNLRTAVPDCVAAFEVVCYFRRPDHYVESRYNQEVKRDLFVGDLAEFLQLIEPALSYSTCISTWADVFGKSNCTVRTYETAAEEGLVADFAKHVLDIHLDPLAARGPTMNERVSRDLLEFKRLANGDPRRANRITEYRILRTIERRMRLFEVEPASYQDFFSPAERAEFLARLTPETEALVAAYDMVPFPASDPEGESAGWKPYPGLSADRLEAITREYRSVRSSAGFRLERMIIGARRAQPAGRMGRVLLRGLRKARVKHLLLKLARRGRREEAW